MTLRQRAMTAPEGSLSVVESGEFMFNGTHAQVSVGNGLSMQIEPLHEVCSAEVDDLSRDLAVVLAAIKCADRTFRRQHACCWGRRLAVTVPVQQVAIWQQDKVRSSLVGALQYLTGDEWYFDFVEQRRKDESPRQLPLLISPDRPRVFIPFSHGLDSFAQSELSRDEDEGPDVLPVHLRPGRAERTMKSLQRPNRSKPALVAVSAQVDEPKHAEPSFRTRPFLYDGLAALAAVLSGGGRVLIPENGQGSLGGSLVRLGAEAPHRSCHPEFTGRLRQFFEHLTGKEVRFEHPALFQTKGQVLKELHRVHPDSAAWLRSHPSCSYDARHANRDGRLVHCGVCGNCLLRRMSLHAAGIDDDPASYKVSDVHAASLEGALVEGDKLRSLKAFKDIAHNAARSMHRLAELPASGNTCRVAAEAERIARYQKGTPHEVHDALDHMLEQHSREWSAFLRHCGRSSWVTQLARG